MTSRDGDEVYLIGLPERTHPGGSRYFGFCRHLDATFLSSPIQSRFFWSRWGWSANRWAWYLDKGISKLARRPYYTHALLLMELSVGAHMLRHRGSIYHAVEGDVDLCMLPRISRKTGTHLVATFHRPAHQLEYWRIDRRITDHLAGAILLSESQRPYFENRLPPERIHVVHHGVDTERYSPSATRTTDPICVTVGSYFRDAAILADAMYRIWTVNPRVRLRAIGTRRAGDPNAVHLDELLDDGRVEFFDRISEEQLLAAYRSARVAILPVVEAIANNALLEAMACGVPVVATDVGGIREYLGEGAGVLCPPGDAQALADAVLRILDDPAAERSMGAAGRERALRFDHAVIAERLRGVYAETVRLGPR